MPSPSSRFRADSEPSNATGLPMPHSVCKARPRSCSADWRSIKKPTFRAQRIHAAIDLQWRSLTEIAVEDLAIIADELDGAISPFRVESHRFVEVAFKSEQTPDLRVFGCRLFIDILGRHAQFFRIDHREVDPFHDIEPTIVALPYDRP